MADAALEAGGDVVGIIPRALRRGLAHASLPDLRPVGSMHEREAMMVASLGMR